MRRVLDQREVQGNQMTLKQKIDAELKKSNITLKNLKEIRFQEAGGLEGEYLATIYFYIFI